jgi:ubiquitin carboxyl-terminal hydrolase 34
MLHGFNFLFRFNVFRLTIDQVGLLWESLATDGRCSDDLFVWLTGQVRMRDQHALSHGAFRYILLKKLPSLPPETISMHSLTLFQQLCNLARISGLQEDAAESSMDYLWKIALYANNTDVSLTAIQYLNNYYIGRQLEKEEEFVERCMCHLEEATKEINLSNLSDEAPLLRIQRALLLLKTHLEIFRRRYAYHLRKWFLEGKGVGSHAQLVGEKGAVTVRVVIQPAGFHDKVTLELISTDYVADLRAEVAKWWETVQVSVSVRLIFFRYFSFSASQSTYFIFRVIWQ